MSRSDGRSTPLRRRPSRTIPALVAATVLLAAAAALVWVTTARLVTGAWAPFLRDSRDWLAGLAWNDPGIYALGAGVALIGVIALLCAVIPGQFTAQALRNPGSDHAEGESRPGGSETVMTRRGVARLAKAAGEQIDGVASASATATTHRVHVKVTTSLRDAGDLRARAVDSVRSRLEGAGLDPVPRITASIETKG